MSGSGKKTAQGNVEQPGRPKTAGEFIAPLHFSTSSGDISPRRLALLAAIGETGSISAAAKQIGITYKTAWDGVEAMNNLAGMPLVHSKHGGSGGGGAELSKAGRHLVADLQGLQELQTLFWQRVQEAGGDLAHSLNVMKRLNMNTSARNTLYGAVSSLKEGAVNTEVSVQLAGGDFLHAIVTSESARELGLSPGREVQALIKASWIILAEARSGLRTSARNCLEGTVCRILPGQATAEVILELNGGNTLAAVITRESLNTLSIQEGDRLCALIKASHIILAVQC